MKAFRPPSHRPLRALRALRGRPLPRPDEDAARAWEQRRPTASTPLQASLERPGGLGRGLGVDPPVRRR